MPKTKPFPFDAYHTIVSILRKLRDQAIVVECMSSHPYDSGATFQRIYGVLKDVDARFQTTPEAAYVTITLHQQPDHLVPVTPFKFRVYRIEPVGVGVKLVAEVKAEY